MGTEAVWVPYVIAALGAGAGAVNARNVAKKQENIAARGIAAQSRRQADADARLADATRELGASSPEAERAEALDNFEAQLRASKASASGTADVPTGSNRYQTETAGAKADIQKYGGQLADIASRINAPLRQRDREKVGLRRAESDVAGIARNAAGAAWLNQLLAGSVTPNTALSIAGPLLQGVGQGMAGSGFGTSASSASLAEGQRAGMESVMRGIRGARRVPIVI